MGIVTWVQNRFHAKQGKRRPANPAPGTSPRNAPARQHRRDQDNGAGRWSLLSIGTLGNEQPTPAPHFTIEEVKKLKDALKKLLRRDEEHNLPLDWFLNCPSSLDVDRRISLRLQATDAGKYGPELSTDTQILLSTSDGVGGVKHKSFNFLLHKMFACRGGFAPQPSFKDPVETELEKLFMTMLHKKTSAPSPEEASSSSRNYYLEDKPMAKIQMDGCHEKEEVCKWDKTDSDFIVLEV